MTVRQSWVRQWCLSLGATAQVQCYGVNFFSRRCGQFAAAAAAAATAAHAGSIPCVRALRRREAHVHDGGDAAGGRVLSGSGGLLRRARGRGRGLTRSASDRSVWLAGRCTVGCDGTFARKGARLAYRRYRGWSRGSRASRSGEERYYP